MNNTTKKSPDLHQVTFSLVRVTRLELVRRGHTPLKRACLPIPAHSRTTVVIISLRTTVVNHYF